MEGQFTRGFMSAARSIVHLREMLGSFSLIGLVGVIGLAVTAIYKAYETSEEKLKASLERSKKYMEDFYSSAKRSREQLGEHIFEVRMENASKGYEHGEGANALRGLLEESRRNQQMASNAARDAMRDAGAAQLKVTKASGESAFGPANLTDSLLNYFYIRRNQNTAEYKSSEAVRQKELSDKYQSRVDKLTSTLREIERKQDAKELRASNDSYTDAILDYDEATNKSPTSISKLNLQRRKLNFREQSAITRQSDISGPEFDNDIAIKKERDDLDTEIINVRTELLNNKREIAIQEYKNGTNATEQSLRERSNSTSFRLAGMNPNDPYYGVNSSKIQLEQAQHEELIRRGLLIVANDFQGPNKQDVIDEATNKLAEAVNKVKESERKVKEELNEQITKLDHIKTLEMDRDKLITERGNSRINTELKINQIYDARANKEISSGFNFGDPEAGRITPRRRLADRLKLQNDSLREIGLHLQEQSQDATRTPAERAAAAFALAQYNSDVGVLEKHRGSNGLFHLGWKESQDAKADILRLGEQSKVGDVWGEMNTNLKSIKIQMDSVSVALQGAKP